MTAIGFPSRVLVKKGNEKHSGHFSVCFFCPLERIKKRPTPTQKKQKLAKGTRENAHMNSAVVV